MARQSYEERVEATVELNLTDFREKLFLADVEMDKVAASTEWKRTGTSFSETGDAMIDAAIDQMEDFVREVMVKSLVQVPEDTGVLKRSARPGPDGPNEEAVEPKFKNGRIRVTFGYGYGDEVNPKYRTKAAQYALPVHEIYDAAHKPPTKSHYLIDPLIEAAGDYGDQLKIALQNQNISRRLRVNKDIFLFRKGGGPGINPLIGPGGILRRKRGTSMFRREVEE